MKKLMTISQAARETGVSVGIIRRNTNSGGIRCKRNPKNNYRMFDLEEVIEDLKKLRLIV